MKNFFNLSALLITSLSILLFTACQKNQDNNNIDLETLKQKISNDGNHQSYMAASMELYENIAEGKIDLMDIHSKLKLHNVQDYCNFDHSLLGEATGAKLFFESYCIMNTNFMELNSAYEELRYLTQSQLKDLYSASSSKSTVPLNPEGRTYGIDCIDAFQFALMFAPVDLGCNIEESYCMEYALDVAIDVYNDCCKEENNSGCP